MKITKKTINSWLNKFTYLGFPFLIILGIVLTGIVFYLTFNVNEDVSKCESANITDILSVSAGGFGNPTVYLYETDKGKVISNYIKQIGDKVCLSK